MHPKYLQSPEKAVNEGISDYTEEVQEDTIGSLTIDLEDFDYQDYYDPFDDPRPIDVFHLDDDLLYSEY